MHTVTTGDRTNLIFLTWYINSLLLQQRPAREGQGYPCYQRHMMMMMMMISIPSYMYIYIYVYINGGIDIYIYIYIYVCVCVCVCMYIYIYIERERQTERDREDPIKCYHSGPEWNWEQCNKGVLFILQSASITGASPSDCFTSLSGHLFENSYPSAEIQSVYSTAPAESKKEYSKKKKKKKDKKVKVVLKGSWSDKEGNYLWWWRIHDIPLIHSLWDLEYADCITRREVRTFTKNKKTKKKKNKDYPKYDDKLNLIARLELLPGPHKPVRVLLMVRIELFENHYHYIGILNTI